MKNVKVKVLALMLAAIMVLSGCASASSGIIINQDGTAKVIQQVSIDQTAANAELKKQGMSDTEIELFWTEYIKELKTSGVGEVKEVTKNGKPYVEMYYSENYTKGSLGKKLGLGENSYVTTDTVYGVIDLSDMQQTGGDDMSQALAMLSGSSSITMTLSVVMPKDIVTTNGTISETNKKQAIFNVKLNQKNTIFATTASGVTMNSIKAKVEKANKVKKAKIKKLTAKKASKKSKKRAISLKISKVSKAKYEIQYGTKKNFSKATTKTIKKTSYTIKNLKKGTKYYVRVRAVKQNLAGYDVYSAWSKKSIKTKK